MKELTLREIQLGELEGLKKIKQICDKEGIHYSLFCGTLLGAIRHKGVIPWDDDIDVAMMRDDYEKFLSYCTTHTEEIKPFQLYHYTTKKDYIYPIARFVDTRYWIDYKDYKDYDLGLFVDIYPIDGCGNSVDERNRIFKKVRGHLLPLITLGGRTNVLKNHGILNYVGKHFLRLLAMTIGQNRLIRIVDERAKRYCPKNSRFVICIIWDSFESGYYLADYFEKQTEVLFEGELFKVPERYEEMLHIQYGDYMQLPPKSERVGHHYYRAYLKENLK